MKKTHKKKLSHKKKFSLLFFCITLLVYSTCFMIKNGGITYTSVVGAFTNILPYCFAIGGLGYIIGAIIDMPRKIKPKYDKAMMDKLVKNLPPQEIISKEIQQPSSSPLMEEIDIKVDTEVDN